MTRTLLIAAVLVFSTACADPGGPVDQLRLELSLSQSAIVTGDTLTVVVRAINRTWHVVRISGSSTCVLSMEVRDASGAYASTPNLCTADEREFDIAAHDTLEATRRWIAVGPPVYGVREPIAPGSYRVLGLLYSRQGKLSRSATVQVVAE